MEVGVGIHGEPGRQRVPLAPAQEIAAMLVDPILADLDFTGGDGVICFVNGMGGTPLHRAVPDVRRGRALLEKAASAWRARWSGRTSPAWTWPAAR